MTRLARLPIATLLGAGALLAAVALGLAWLVPSPDYLYIPDRARSLDSYVKVEGAEERDTAGGIYFLDVHIRKASWLERYVSALRPEGSTLIPGHAITPPGTSFEDRREEGERQMNVSEKVAAAVALEAAGLDVRQTNHGTLVIAVDPAVPAAETLRPGDVVVAVDARPTRTPNALRTVLAEVKPGRIVQVARRRDGKTGTVPIKTVASPEGDRALLGINVAQDVSITLPRTVDIDLGNVGGPSAGLPFALQVLGDLGRDVDRGYRVAATGEIGLDGSVGPVGGIKQKTIGARKADVDVLLVPAGDNAQEARRYARGLRVIPVRSFQQALDKLATLPSRG